MSIPPTVQKVIDQPGLYLAKSGPGPALLLSSSGGKLFALKLDQELKPDRFFPNVQFRPIMLAEMSTLEKFNEGQQPASAANDPRANATSPAAATGEGGDGRPDRT